jgi:c-di-GMP-binding flagellar brake protein YcgR
MENGSGSYPVCPGVSLEMPLQTTVEGIGTFRSTLIGAEHGRHLLVKMPHVPDLASKLYQKNHIIVRYLHAGKVYGFRSTLIGMIREPVRLCVISYPEALESHNTRNHERFDCVIPASVKHAADQGGREWKGVIVDMSMGGCRFRTKAGDRPDLARLAMGESLSLSFGLLGEETRHILVAELRSLVQDTEQITMGLLFGADVETESQRKALEFIRGMITNLLN